MTTKSVLLLCLCAAVALCLPTVALAQGSTAPNVSITVAEIFKDGGTIGWVIVVLSVIMLAMTIENAVNIRKDKLAPPEVIDEIEALFEAGDYQEAIELCESEPTYFTKIVAAGLPKMNAGFDEMKRALAEALDSESLRLQAKVGWLNVINAIAPMLGLLGTIQGMIVAFKTVAATKGSADPSQLSGGISGALVTTLFGLLVAIPGTYIYVFFRNKIVWISMEVGGVVEDLFERFRPGKATA
jgi:biopolymer transport protein ExbB